MKRLAAILVPLLFITVIVGFGISTYHDIGGSLFGSGVLKYSDRKYSDQECEGIAGIYVEFAQVRDVHISLGAIEREPDEISPEMKEILRQIYVDYKDLNPQQIHDKAVQVCQSVPK
jgi:hypothetical protein